LVQSAVGDLTDDYPVDPANVERDAGLARWAVRVHRPQEWPAGRFCVNCRQRWPCRLARWGVAVLVAAGWSEQDIAACAADVVPADELDRPGAP
jgi:hypothetical protein